MYGKAPINLGIFDIRVKEAMYYLYMPIKMADQGVIFIPDRLKIFSPIIAEVCSHAWRSMQNFGYLKSYVYITVKHMYVGAGVAGNRPGWHSDGFMSDDLNYIWCDKHPTIFNCSDFSLSQDDKLSMVEMEEQAEEENSFTYPAKSLLLLDQYVIHKVPDIIEGGMRTFLKISISKDKYDLEGNTHNHLMKYDWAMTQREVERNIPQSVGKKG